MDQTNIAVNAAVKISNDAGAIIEALNDLVAIKDQLSGAGIDFTTYDSALNANANTMHCDSSTYKNIINYFASDIITFLKGDYNGTPTQQAYNGLEKARRI